MVAPAWGRNEYPKSAVTRTVEPVASQVARDDVPWRPSSRTWLRRLTLARYLLLVPLSGALIYARYLGFIADASRVFAAILFATTVQTLLHRFGARDGSSERVATPCLFSSLIADGAMLAVIASATSGLASPFAFALVLPVAIGGLTLAFAPASAVAVSAIVALLLLAQSEPASQSSLPVVARALGVGGVLLATFAGARWFRARLQYLEARLVEREATPAPPSSLEPRVADVEFAGIDFEELPLVATEMERGPPLLPSSARTAAFEEAALASIANQLGSELRDPAGIIRARAESLRFELKDRERRDQILAEFERLLRAADRVDDVRLTLATLAKTAAPGHAECDARALVLELRTAFVDEFERDGVKLRLEAPRGVSPVALSHNELRLIVVRLIDASRRAALAASRNIRVTARVSSLGSGVCLEVEDNLMLGAIPPVDAAPTHDVEKRPGLGLALSVARHILALRGGMLEVVPRRGGGFAIRAHLPVAASKSNAAF